VGITRLASCPGRAKAPRPYGTPLDKNHRSKAAEIVRRFRSTVLYLKWQDLQIERPSIYLDKKNPYIRIFILFAV
jgi:hypothetical protein